MPKTLLSPTILPALALLAAPLLAQDEGDLPPLPSWKGVRYAEDWSVLAGYPPERLEDPRLRIKYLPLDEDGDFWLSLGGHFRARLEAWNDFRFGAVPPGAEEDDVHGLARLYLHADLHAGEHVRAFVEGKSALAFDRDLPGGERPVDEDQLDLQNGFLDLSTSAGDGRATLRAGRQELLFGKQRLVSPLDWANSRRSFDGVSAIWSSGPWSVHGFAANLVVPDRDEFNESDDGVDFYGVYATRARGGREIDLYWLGLEKDDVSFNGTTGDQQRHTFGARHGGLLGAGSQWDHDLEGAVQVGEVGGEDVEAWMFAAELGRRFPGARGKPRAWIGVDYASGDEDPGGDVETFDQHFPLGHAWLGYVDAVGRQNVLDLRAGASAVPAEGWLARLELHHFRLASDDDALYDASGAATFGPVGEDHVGEEIDLTLLWRPDRHQTVLLGYSRFFAGDFLDEAGPGEDVDFAYASYQYVF